MRAWQNQRRNARLCANEGRRFSGGSRSNVQRRPLANRPAPPRRSAAAGKQNQDAIWGILSAVNVTKAIGEGIANAQAGEGKADAPAEKLEEVPPPEQPLEMAAANGQVPNQQQPPNAQNPEAAAAILMFGKGDDEEEERKNADADTQVNQARAEMGGLGPEWVSQGVQADGSVIFHNLQAGLTITTKPSSTSNPTGDTSGPKEQGRDSKGQFLPLGGDETSPGSTRANRVQSKLEGFFRGASVQRELDLRDAEGNIVKDPITGEGRRLDHVVIKDGKALAVVESTSEGSSKSSQESKEMRIRGAGGTFVRDRNTGKLISISGVPARTMRVK